MEYEHKLISEHYAKRTAKRSRVPLMNHINEGLEILDEFSSPYYTPWLLGVVKGAFCLHPLIQDPKDFALNYQRLCDDPKVCKSSLVLAAEYRLHANAYLCRPGTDGWTQDDIANAVGPLCSEIRAMLIADKRQNQKDFLRYHKRTHPRSEQLTKYFENWLEYLK